MAPGQWQSGRRPELLTAWGQNPECPPEFLRIAHHPRLLDQALRQSKEGSACVLDVRTRRQNATKLTTMSASPSHTRYDSILDRKDLVDTVVPVRKRGVDTLDITLEIEASDHCFVRFCFSWLSVCKMGQIGSGRTCCEKNHRGARI